MKNMKLFDWILFITGCIFLLFSMLVLKGWWSAVFFWVFMAFSIGWAAYKIFGITKAWEDWLIPAGGFLCGFLGIVIFKAGWTAWFISVFFATVGWALCMWLGGKEPVIKI